MLGLLKSKPHSIDVWLKLTVLAELYSTQINFPTQASPHALVLAFRSVNNKLRNLMIHLS